MSQNNAIWLTFAHSVLTAAIHMASVPVVQKPSLMSPFLADGLLTVQYVWCGPRNPYATLISAPGATVRVPPPPTVLTPQNRGCPR